jgi:hypothetical protein
MKTRQMTNDMARMFEGIIAIMLTVLTKSAGERRGARSREGKFLLVASSDLFFLSRK